LGTDISIKFTSVNQKIDFSIKCNDKDKFYKIEDILYEQYPEYRDSENYFICNGKKINKYRSLGENDIKNGSIIILEIIE